MQPVHLWMLLNTNPFTYILRSDYYSGKFDLETKNLQERIAKHNDLMIVVKFRAHHSWSLLLRKWSLGPHSICCRVFPASFSGEVRCRSRWRSSPCLSTAKFRVPLIPWKHSTFPDYVQCGFVVACGGTRLDVGVTWMHSVTHRNVERQSGKRCIGHRNCFMASLDAVTFSFKLPRVWF